MVINVRWMAMPLEPALSLTGKIFKSCHNINMMGNEEEFIGKPELEKKNDDSQVFVCTQCGECCHIREKKNLDEKEEQLYLDYMFQKYGIIYAAELSKITINVWPEERIRLEEEAKKKSIKVRIMPKRAIYDDNGQELIILDYFIDHDICPFFNKEDKLCTVYDIRPQICRSYPLITSKTLGKCRYKKLDANAYDMEKVEAEKLGRHLSKQKSAVNELLKTIKLPISRHLSKEMIEKAKIKELRIKS